MFNIEDELKKLPHKPGVYIMRNKDDKIIYVGKAISLKNRVTQYFRKTNKTQRIKNMVSLIDHFEYIVCDNEAEALILECNLIKEILDAYIKHLEEVITKRTEYDLEKAKLRMHIVEGLIKALSILDEIIKTIRASKNKEVNVQNCAKTPFLTKKAFLPFRLLSPISCRQ